MSKIANDIELERICESTLADLHNYPDTSLKNRIKNIIKKNLGRDYKNLSMINWPSGLLLKGLVDACECAGLEEAYKTKLADEIKNYMDKSVDKNEIYSVLDYAIAGEAFLFLYKQTNNECYKSEADKLYDFLKVSLKNSEGSLIYRPSQGNDYVLADMLGMVCPFLTQYGVMFDIPEAVELAENQILGFIKHGMDIRTGLPYHGYSLITGDKFGIVGWGRAVGWILMAEASYLSINAKSAVNPAYSTIKNECYRMIKAIEKYISEDGGLSWHLLSPEDHMDSSSIAFVLSGLMRLYDVADKDTKIDTNRDAKIDTKIDTNQDAKVGANKDTEVCFEPDADKDAGTYSDKDDENYSETETDKNTDKCLDNGVADRLVMALRSCIEDGRVLSSSAECISFGMYPQIYGHYPWAQGAALSALALYLGKES